MSRLMKEKLTSKNVNKKKVPNFAYENKTTPLTKLNIKQGGNDTYQMYLKNDDKPSFTREEAYTAVKAFQLEIIAKYGSKFTLSVSAKDTRFGWRRGYTKSILDDVILWSSEYADTGGAPDEEEDDDDQNRIEALAFSLIRTD
jgi:hypothetical protein